MVNDSIFSKIENQNSIKIIDLLQQILNSINEITEFNERELKAISILETDPFFQEYLEFFIDNKKHVKRKHARELLESLKAIAEAIQPNENITESRWFRK